MTRARNSSCGRDVRQFDGHEPRTSRTQPSASRCVEQSCSPVASLDSVLKQTDPAAVHGELWTLLVATLHQSWTFLGPVERGANLHANHSGFGFSRAARGAVAVAQHL